MTRTRSLHDQHIFSNNFSRFRLTKKNYCQHHDNLSQVLIQAVMNHFFSEEERELAEVILKFEVCGFPLSVYRVRLLAFQYAHINCIKGFSTKNKIAGYKWAKGYLARNPDIVVKKCSNLSVARAMAANPTNIQQWFAKYLAVLEQFEIHSPEQIWSGDETGVQNVPAVSKVLGHQSTTAHRQVSGEQGETSTVLTFVNACGRVCPPMVIHKGTHVNQSWLTNQQGARVAATTNGYITKSKFHEYAIRFVLFLKRNGLLDRTHLLIIDSHKSHVYNYPFLQYMLSNNIQVMAIPAHCSHIVQPLDNVPFACFKRSWEKHLDNWNFQHLGALLNNSNFFTVFNRAFYSAMSESNIRAGFKNTGIYPVNFEAIPTSKMAPSYVTDIFRHDNSKMCWKIIRFFYLKNLCL